MRERILEELLKTEKEMPAIKNIAEDMEEAIPDWNILNELFLRIVS